MEPYWADGQVALHLGDCLDVLAAMPDASVDAIITDPPYGLEFMGKEWDKFGRDTGNGYQEKPRITHRPGREGSLSAYSGAAGNGINYYTAGRPYQQWCQQWAAECLRVLKPGGHMLAFGGTRTWHRLTCAIEDAGFEIRDSTADLTGIDGPGLLWIYGQGFPKSRNIAKDIDAIAGAEREVIAEGKPMKRIIPGADQNRTGSWIKNNGREFVPTVTAPATEDAARWEGWGTALKPSWEPIVVARKPMAGTVARNVLEHGTGALNIAGCRTKGGPSAGGATSGSTALGQGSGWNAHNNRPTEIDRTMADGRWPPNIVLGAAAATELDRQSGHSASRIGKPRAAAPGDGWGMTATGAEYADTGGASRFYPVFRYQAKAGAAERPRLEDGTSHPTVKPVSLMAWLVRLVTPPGGLVLDPFAGSGTTAEACIMEGFRCVLVEKDPKSAELIRARLRKDIQPNLFGGAA